MNPETGVTIHLWSFNYKYSLQRRCVSGIFNKGWHGEVTDCSCSHGEVAGSVSLPQIPVPAPVPLVTVRVRQCLLVCVHQPRLIARHINTKHWQSV